MARMMNPRGFLTEQEKANMPSVTWDLIRRILGYLTPYWTRFVLVFATILISSGVRTASSGSCCGGACT